MTIPGLGYGLGLRRQHYADLIDSPASDGDRVDFFEAITENYLVAGGNPLRALRAVRERWPVVLHGVSLSIGSLDPLDEGYLAQVAALCAELQPQVVSDHLCWSSLGGHTVHDLWPLPYTEEALQHVAERVMRAQDRLGRRILLENPSTYATFVASAIEEAPFLAEVAARADCGILLDINNIFVSCQNHGWDPAAYLAAIPPERVGYLHLAGHIVEDALRIDTHDQPVCDDVWALYAEAVRHLGPVATCLERDDNIPPLHEVVAELDRARAVAAAAAAGSSRA